MMPANVRSAATISAVNTAAREAEHEEAIPAHVDPIAHYSGEGFVGDAAPANRAPRVRRVTRHPDGTWRFSSVEGGYPVPDGFRIRGDENAANDDARRRFRAR